MIEILFKKLEENAVLPNRKYVESAGYDLIATSCKYNPKYDRFEYGLGFATKIPFGYEAEIRPRSSNTKTEAYIPNAPGTIDADYTGEWKVFYKLRTPFDILFPTETGELDRNGNKIKSDRELNILEMENELAPYKVGDAVAQVLFHKVEDVWVHYVTELPITNRGSDGGINRDDAIFTV